MKKATPTTKPATVTKALAKPKAKATSIRPGHIVFDDAHGVPGIVVKVGANGELIILNTRGDLYTQSEIENTDWTPAPGTPLDLAADVIAGAVSGFQPVAAADPYHAARMELIRARVRLANYGTEWVEFDDRSAKESVDDLTEALTAAIHELGNLSMMHAFSMAEKAVAA